MNETIWIDYTNWRDDRSWRRIKPVPGGISFTASSWHERQWLLKAADEEDPQRQVKDFALLNIYAFAAEKPTEGRTMDVTRLTDEEIDTLQKQLFHENVRRQEEAEKARVEARRSRNERIVARAQTLLKILQPDHSGDCDDLNYAEDIADCPRCALLHALEYGELPDAGRLEFALTLTRGD